MRGDALLKLVIEEIMDGKRPNGRPRIGIMGITDDIMMGSYAHMKRRALGREG